MGKEICKKVEEFNPDENPIVDLCCEEGSGFDFIDDSNRELFYPLLMAIEETVVLYFRENQNMKDMEIVESLKKIRDNLFDKSFEFNQLEQQIIRKIKRILFLNCYNKKDVLLSVSNILNSAKRHRAAGGARGYLTFIVKMFDDLGETNENEESLDSEEEDELWEGGGFAEGIKPEEMDTKMRTFYMGHDEEMDFNCKNCNAEISAHSKDWHDGMCDKCFNDKCKEGVYVKDE